MTTTECAQQHLATFGAALRVWRRSRRLSQKELGELLEPRVHPSTVTCWESGLRFPTWKYLRQIIALTGISADLALGGHHPAQKGARP